MARYGWFSIAEAIVSTTSYELQDVAEGWHQDAMALSVEVLGSNTPNWTVQFNGKYHPSSAYQPIDHIQTGQAGVSVLKNTAEAVVDTTSRVYTIPNPPPFVQVVATRVAGDLTLRGWFNSTAYTQWSLPDTATAPSADQLVIGGTTYTVKSARLEATASGNTLLIAAVAAKQIMIAAWHVTVSANTVIRLQDVSGPTVLVGPLNFANNDRDSDPFPKSSDQRGATNSAINVNRSNGTGRATVSVRYVEANP